MIAAGRYIHNAERENEMRFFVAALVVIAVLYYGDVNYNESRFSDGLIRMERSMFHSMGH